MDQVIQKLTNMTTEKDFIPLYNNIYESDYTVNFDHDITLKDSVDNEIAFIWGKATNSFFNISEKNRDLNTKVEVHGKQFNYQSVDIKQLMILTWE